MTTEIELNMEDHLSWIIAFNENPLAYKDKMETILNALTQINVLIPDKNSEMYYKSILCELMQIRVFQCADSNKSRYYRDKILERIPIKYHMEWIINNGTETTPVGAIYVSLEIIIKYLKKNDPTEYDLGILKWAIENGDGMFFMDKKKEIIKVLSERKNQL